MWPAILTRTTKWYSSTRGARSKQSAAQASKTEAVSLLHNIGFEQNRIRIWVCEVTCGLYTEGRVASWEWQMALWASAALPRSSSAVGTSQAKETHMVHRWKTTPVCDAELLLSLIYEDKPIHKIWNNSLSSLNSKWKRKPNSVDLDCTDLSCLVGTVPFCSCE